jgi:hypothetical protein
MFFVDPSPYATLGWKAIVGDRKFTHDAHLQFAVTGSNQSAT